MMQFVCIRRHRGRGSLITSAFMQYGTRSWQKPYTAAISQPDRLYTAFLRRCSDVTNPSSHPFPRRVRTLRHEIGVSMTCHSDRPRTYRMDCTPRFKSFEKRGAMIYTICRKGKHECVALSRADTPFSSPLHSAAAIRVSTIFRRFFLLKDSAVDAMQLPLYRNVLLLRDTILSISVAAAKSTPHGMRLYCCLGSLSCRQPWRAVPY